MSLRYPVVLWDSGGTIFHIPSGRALCDHAPREISAGRSYRAAKALEMFGHSPPANLAEIIAELDGELSASLGERHSIESLAAAVYSRLGLPAQPPEQMLLADAIAGPRYCSWLADGVADALAELSAAGVRMGVVANTTWTSRMLRQAFIGTGLGDYFGAVVCSCDIGIAKPAGRIFAAAAAALRPPVAPGEPVLYVGDSLENDVLGAAAMGWDAAYHITGPAGSAGQAVLDFTDYCELVNLVCRR